MDLSQSYSISLHAPSAEPIRPHPTRQERSCLSPRCALQRVPAHRECYEYSGILPSVQAEGGGGHGLPPLGGHLRVLAKSLLSWVVVHTLRPVSAGVGAGGKAPGAEQAPRVWPLVAERDRLEPAELGLPAPPPERASSSSPSACLCGSIAELAGATRIRSISRDSPVMRLVVPAALTSAGSCGGAGISRNTSTGISRTSSTGTSTSTLRVTSTGTSTLLSTNFSTGTSFGTSLVTSTATSRSISTSLIASRGTSRTTSTNTSLGTSCVCEKRSSASWVRVHVQAEREVGNGARADSRQAHLDDLPHDLDDLGHLDDLDHLLDDLDIRHHLHFLDHLNRNAHLHLNRNLLDHLHFLDHLAIHVYNLLHFNYLDHLLLHDLCDVAVDILDDLNRHFLYHLHRNVHKLDHLLDDFPGYLLDHLHLLDDHAAPLGARNLCRL
mmetsp:Transcript_65485/g.146106  ORF Transcript_65485/g.146106 Transcript_65485/m.146106 type:complete len:439 (+) Transcript_65485:93-1409(+)